MALALAGRDLPNKARKLGLNVLELSGWESRGEGGVFSPKGILLHHDAMGLGYVDKNLSNNLNVPKYMSQNGNDGSQLWIGLDTSGKMTLVFLAAGLKWHAGSGSGWGAIPGGSGNATLIGIETDHTIGTGWTAEMVRYIDLTSILLKKEFGFDPMRWCAGHKEYAPARKIDPEGFDLNAWRKRVAAGTTATLPNTPVVEKPTTPTAPPRNYTFIEKLLSGKPGMEV